MAQENRIPDDFNQVLSDQLVFLEALTEIFILSDQAEVIRIVTAALTRTQAGINYLTAHPITL